MKKLFNNQYNFKHKIFFSISLLGFFPPETPNTSFKEFLTGQFQCLQTWLLFLDFHQPSSSIHLTTLNGRRIAVQNLNPENLP